MQGKSPKTKPKILSKLNKKILKEILNLCGLIFFTMARQLTYTNKNKTISYGSFLCKDGCIVYKIVRIADANLFLDYIEEDNVYVVRANKSIPKALIEQYVRNNYEWIANWYKNIENPQPWLIFGQQVPVKVILGNEYKTEYLGNQIIVYLRHKRDFRDAVKNFYKKFATSYFMIRLQEKLKELNLKANFGKVTWANYYLGMNHGGHTIDFNAKLIQYPKEYIDSVIYHEIAHITHMNHKKVFWNLLDQYCPNRKEIDKLYWQTTTKYHTW